MERRSVARLRAISYERGEEDIRLRGKLDLESIVFPTVCLADVIFEASARAYKVQFRQFR